MWKRIALAAAIAGGVYQFWATSRLVAVDPGLSQDFPLDLARPLPLAAAPVQNPIESQGPGYAIASYQLRPLASLQLAARVLGVKWYRFGREADLSPVDLALGWGPMADESVLQEVEISQSGRYYRWRVARFPIPRRSIETHSANMHIIPGTPEVADGLRDIGPGERVKLHGYLVRVEAEDGWRWQSSLTRSDTGAHACELLLLQHLEVF